MGTIEREARHERRLGAFQQAALETVAVGTVAPVSITASSFARFLRYFPGCKNGAKFNYQYKSALGRLADKGLVIFIEKGDKRYARITEKGERVLQMKMEHETIMKKRKWDHRWRVVIFDIPERRRGVRVRLRHFMEEYGFVRLQDSVWIYPYDCEDFIALVKANLRVGADVLYMIVERLERDTYLREHFSLNID